MLMIAWSVVDLPLLPWASRCFLIHLFIKCLSRYPLSASTANHAISQISHWLGITQIHTCFYFTGSLVNGPETIGIKATNNINGKCLHTILDEWERKLNTTPRKCKTMEMSNLLSQWSNNFCSQYRIRHQKTTLLCDLVPHWTSTSPLLQWRY